MKRIVAVIVLCVCCAICSIDATAGGNPKSKKMYPKFTRADSLHGTLSPLRSCYDVRFYDISVAVFPETKSIKGLVSMDFLFVDSTQTVMQLDLSSKLDIFDISIDGTPIHDYRRATLSAEESTKQKRQYCSHLMVAILQTLPAFIILT